MRTLKDIKVVDMKKSVIDEQRSDVEKQKFTFKKKVYSKYPFASEKYKFKWGRHTERGEAIEEWIYLFNASFVTAKDGFWPEPPAHLNSEGHFQFGDAVLMKIPIRDYIAKMKASMGKSSKKSQALKRQFQRDIGKLDKGAVMSDDQLAKELGFEPGEFK